MDSLKVELERFINLWLYGRSCDANPSTFSVSLNSVSSCIDFSAPASVRPHLEYAAVVWDPEFLTQKNPPN